MAIATLERLGKRYGPRLAVDDVSFDVRDREVMGLLGPNGSGKSTILRIVAGYLSPSAGTATVGGFDVVRDGIGARGRVGYVPEDVPLYRHMRVDEFLAFMGRLRGLSGRALERAIDLSCERVALGPVRRTLIERLSRGYRQRVSLAQAVLHEPALLILDEPTNGLDPRQIIDLRGLIRSLSGQCAVLVTSHILAEVDRIADRVAVLLDGRLLAVHEVERSAGLRVRAPKPSSDRVVAVLSATPGIVSVAREDAGGDVASWRVRVASVAATEDLVSRLGAAGLLVVEIDEPASELERIFLSLTAGRALH